MYRTKRDIITNFVIIYLATKVKVIFVNKKAYKK